jgi:hypothetical protein
MKITKENLDLRIEAPYIWKPMHSWVYNKVVMNDYFKIGYICLLFSICWFLASSILKMEKTLATETSVDFQRTGRRYISERWTLYNHLCESLRFCIGYTYLLLCGYVLCELTWNAKNFQKSSSYITNSDQVSCHNGVRHDSTRERAQICMHDFTRKTWRDEITWEIQA